MPGFNIGQFQSMKHLIIILFIFSGQYGIAQIKGFVGVKGGALLSNTYIEHTIYNTFMNTGFTPGYNGGVIMKLFTKEPKIRGMNGGLQTGLFVERKGWRQIFDTTEPDYHCNMTYAVLPLEALGYIGKGNTKLFFTLGIFVEHLVDVQKDSDPDLDNIGRGVEFYTYSADRDNDFGYGIRASTGLQQNFSFGAVHIDAFVSYTASSFIQTTEFDDRLPDLTNHYLGGFSIAYLIPFGKLDF
jgi:hypothetical protein